MSCNPESTPMSLKKLLRGKKTYLGLVVSAGDYAAARGRAA